MDNNNWMPNPIDVDELVEMGFEEKDAVNALKSTRHLSISRAICLIESFKY